MKKGLISKLLFVAVVTFSFLSVTSCDDADVDTGMPTLEISTSELYFDNSGAAADEFGGVVELTTNRSWVVEIDDTAAEWLTVEPLSGDGDAELFVSVPATSAGRSGSFSISVYNSYGVLFQERVLVSQGEVTQGDVVFDGSELPTSYPTDQTITVDGMDFVVNQVANFSTLYDTSGPIQFKSLVSYMYNSVAFEGLKEVTITLAPSGTSYNNFVVTAGTSVNPTEGTVLSPTKDGDVATYTIPDGCQYIRIANPAEYTAYASEIALKTTSGGGTTDPEDPETPDDPQSDEIIFDGSELPTSYPTDETITVGGIDFTVNQVANFTTIYDTSQGPIQFKAAVSYLYNTEAISGVKEVIITLAPEGTSYNNFVVYASSAANGTDNTLTAVKSGDVVTYAVPDGCEYIKIENTSSYTAYAFSIEFSTTSSGTTPEEPEDPDTPDEPQSDEILFDGSELPTAYSTDETITVGGIDFIINQVANFYEAYGSSGPIQFKSLVSYLYNTEAISGVKEVIITLAPEGTSYNNFVVYASSAANGTDNTLTAVKDGDVVTYTVPDGCEYIKIENTSSYTAYAFTIEFSTTSSGTTPEEPEDPETPDEPQSDEILFDGSELPTAYSTDEAITVGGVDFIINQVANFYEAYGSNGPIQFKSAVSYLYNTVAIADLSEVVITLAPEGTSYNNFVLYASSTENGTDNTLEAVKDGDVVTYTVPAGCEYVRIENTSSYTAYAFTIEFNK